MEQSGNLVILLLFSQIEGKPKQVLVWIFMV